MGNRGPGAARPKQTKRHSLKASAMTYTHTPDPTSRQAVAKRGGAKTRLNLLRQSHLLQIPAQRRFRPQDFLTASGGGKCPDWEGPFLEPLRLRTQTGAVQKSSPVKFTLGLSSLGIIH